MIFSYTLRENKATISDDLSPALEFHKDLFGVSQPFTLNTAPLSDLISAHGIKSMEYTVDTQLYLILNRADRSKALPQIETCVCNVKAYSVLNRVMLNDSKTEVIFINSRFVKCMLPPTSRLVIPLFISQVR